MDDSCRETIVEAKLIRCYFSNPGKRGGGLEVGRSSGKREKILDVFYRLIYLLMNWMWDLREKGVKNDPKIFGLSNCKNGVVSD